MISQDLQSLIPRFLKTTRIIWMAFLFGPVFYAVVAWFASGGGAREMASQFPDEAVYLLVLIATLSGPFFSWVIAPRIASPKKMVSQGGDTQLVTDFGEDQARYDRLSETEKKKAQHLGAIQSSFIVQWAGAESVAIFGLIGLFTGMISLYAAWGFILASIVLVGILRPDYEAALENLDV